MHCNCSCFIFILFGGFNQFHGSKLQEKLANSEETGKICYLFLCNLDEPRRTANICKHVNIYVIRQLGIEEGYICRNAEKITKIYNLIHFYERARKIYVNHISQ